MVGCGNLKRSDAPIPDMLGHSQERLLDTGRAFRGGLKERDGQLVCEFLKCQKGGSLLTI